MSWDGVTLGYLAALIDGEGHIVSNGRVRVQVASSDKDIVERALNMSGIGTLTGPYPNHASDKEHWYWKVDRREDCARLLCAIAPLMSERKRTTQILPAAEYLFEHTSRPKTCLFCEEVWTPATGHQTRSDYCSNKCYQAAWYRRKRDENVR